MHKRLLFLIPALLTIVACNKFNKEEKTPAFLHINKSVLNALTEEGTDSSAFVDAIVFVNNENIGQYELPTTIPILEEGSKNLILFGAIRNNGISNDRRAYPFIKQFNSTINLSANNTDTVTPMYTYFEGALEFYLEDFEDPGLKFSKKDGSDTIIFKTSDNNEVYEGLGSGKAVLTTEKPFFQAATTENFELPRTNNRNTYIELNYKCTNSFAIGIVAEKAGQLDQRELAFIAKPTYNTTGDLIWKKIYIELVDEILQSPAGSKFEIFIEASLDPNTSQGTILFDNFKLIYPK